MNHMTSKECTRVGRDWTMNLRLLPALVCLGLLAGCGGSGGNSSDTTQTTEDGTKQIATIAP